MTDIINDPSAALAEAAAQIAMLEQQLGVAQALRIKAEKDATDAAEAKALAEGALGSLQRQLAKAQSDMSVAQAKLDAAFGPVEDGITRGEPTFTVEADGSSHATLRDARMHVLKTTVGLTPEQAQRLVDFGPKVMPVVAKLTGEIK